MCASCSYNGTRAYAQSKLANILHAKEIARQLKGRNARVTVNAVHPGIVKTGIVRDHKGCITGMYFFYRLYTTMTLIICLVSNIFGRENSKSKLISFSNLPADSLFFFASKLLKTSAQGASTTCYVALSPKTEGVTGKYFADCNETNCSTLANDESEAQKLWKQSRALIRRHLHQAKQ
ncbi:hypothetical protein RHGRI_024395 [Rhododendron griersonianum]|uniref:Uncharacterized protein n=1 Tax=Rhododendron griersonianum TaxID=479676 RepID=A0AAV6J895_9ERIC|nr:hypothetical protein RHGRI_024395 [Rhododendron griersonianum]